MLDNLRTAILFLIIGLFELGGCYMIWLWLREQREVWYAVVGAILLILYGIIPTLQPTHFGRVYIVYGGVFIILALLWGWGIDGVRPDRYDLIGVAIVLLGTLVMMYAPRG